MKNIINILYLIMLCSCNFSSTLNGEKDTAKSTQKTNTIMVNDELISKLRDRSQYIKLLGESQIVFGNTWGMPNNQTYCLESWLVKKNNILVVLKATFTRKKGSDDRWIIREYKFEPAKTSS